MEYTTLPHSDLKVSPICIGCWQFNGNEQSRDKTWAAQPEEVSKSIVDKAIELGVNFFDTAEVQHSMATNVSCLGCPSEKKAFLTDLPEKFSEKFFPYDANSKMRRTALAFKSGSYLDSVKMFKDRSGQVTVVASCYHSQKKSEKPHSLQVIIGPTKVTEARCTCKAGIEGECSHMLALIFALSAWKDHGLVDVPENPACTSMPRSWDRPRGRKIRGSALTHVIFSNPSKQNRKRKPVKAEFVDNRSEDTKGIDFDFLGGLGLPISYLSSGDHELVDTEVGPVYRGAGLTYWGYLNSEKVLGRILAGRRRDVVVASKFGTRVPIYTPEEIEISLTNTLRNLQTDYLDLYQIHWPSFIADPQAVFDELKRQQAKGRIRTYGVSNFGPKNLKEAIAAGATPSTNQLSYNLLWRSIEYDILPACRQAQVGVLAYSPLQQGLLSGKYMCLEDVPEGRRRTRLFNSASTSLSVHGEEGAEKQLFHTITDIQAVCQRAGIAMPATALSWLLTRDPVKAVIVGASSPEQVARNVELLKLEETVLNELDEVTKELKGIFGPVVDMWAPKPRMS